MPCYQKQSVLSSALYGVIVLCHDAMKNCNVVMKRILLDNARHHRSMKNLLVAEDIEMEYQVNQLIAEHPHLHLVQMHDSFVENNVLHIIMENCEGGELFDAIEQVGSMPETTSIWIMRQVLTAISYLHYMAICHRDLKPDDRC